MNSYNRPNNISAPGTLSYNNSQQLNAIDSNDTSTCDENCRRKRHLQNNNNNNNNYNNLITPVAVEEHLDAKTTTDRYSKIVGKLANVDTNILTLNTLKQNGSIIEPKLDCIESRVE